MNSEQTQSDKSLELLTWFEVNKKRVLYVAVGILLVGCGLYVSNHLSHQKELEATQALVSAAKIDTTGRLVPATSTDLLGIVDKYSGTAAAERALLQAAGALFVEKKYSESKDKFDQFISKYSNSPFVATAEFGKAACLDAQDQKDQAIAAYQQIVTRFAGEPVVPQAKIAMGILYEAKKQPDQAFKMYSEVASDPRSYFWSREVSQLMNHLLVENPNLDTSSARPGLPVPGVSVPKTAPAPAAAPATKAPATPAPAPAPATKK
jgi:TolA-binding protein